MTRLHNTISGYTLKYEVLTNQLKPFQLKPFRNSSGCHLGLQTSRRKQACYATNWWIKAWSLRCEDIVVKQLMHKSRIGLSKWHVLSLHVNASTSIRVCYSAELLSDSSMVCDWSQTEVEIARQRWFKLQSALYVDINMNLSYLQRYKVLPRYKVLLTTIWCVHSIFKPLHPIICSFNHQWRNNLP